MMKRIRIGSPARTQRPAPASRPFIASGLALVILGAVCATSAHAAAITYLTRTSRVEARVVTDVETAVDSRVTNGFEIFDQSAATSLISPDLSTNGATAHQYSSLGPNSISVTGSASSAPEFGPSYAAQVYAESVFSVSFQVDSDFSFSLDGYFNAYYPGEPVYQGFGLFSLDLVGPTGSMLSELYGAPYPPASYPPPPPPKVFDFTHFGSLSAGTYSLDLVLWVDAVSGPQGVSEGTRGDYAVNLDIAPIPEPSSALLFGVGVGVLVWRRRA